MLILQKPHLTRKSSAYNKHGKYAFIVDVKANKVEIKKQVSKIYNVIVTDVKTMRYSGKKVSRYTKKRIVKGQRNNYKKTIVTLRKGDIIDIHGDAN